MPSLPPAITLHADERGKGPLVVALHDLGRDSDTMLRALKNELTILLVEHDMEAVFALADRISVLVYGRVIASGAPDEIRANALVREAYLGEAVKEGVHV